MCIETNHAQYITSKSVEPASNFYLWTSSYNYLFSLSELHVRSQYFAPHIRQRHIFTTPFSITQRNIGSGSSRSTRASELPLSKTWTMYLICTERNTSSLNLREELSSCQGIEWSGLQGQDRGAVLAPMDRCRSHRWTPWSPVTAQIWYPKIWAKFSLFALHCIMAYIFKLLN